MPIVTALVVFVVRQLVNEPTATAVKLSADWLGTWFKDHSRSLPHAIERANDRAWRSLEIALAGHRLIDKIKIQFASGSDSGIREQVTAFLKTTSNALDSSHAEFRNACLTELRKARKARLLAANAVTSEDLARRVNAFQRFSDPSALVESAWEAAEQVSDELGSEYANLSKLLRQRTAAGSPLLVMAFAHFFREVETNSELSRGLTFDSLRRLSASQDAAFTQLGLALEGIGPRFDELFDQLDQIEQTALDIRDELHRLGGDHAADAQEQRRLLLDIQARLATAGMAAGAVQPRQSLSIRTESERRMVKEMLARFRQLPSEQQAYLPATLNGLGKLMNGAGDFPAAQTAFAEAAQNARDPAAKAEAYFNAYRAALEQEKWDEALKAITQAATLDPERYAPFPMRRYQPRKILGAGGFGAAFLCFDTFMQTEVVVKSLHDGDLDRGVNDVFAEAQALRQLQHPAIIRVLDCNCADSARMLRPYIVMDYFPGGSLEARIREQGNLPAEELLQIATQVADGMKAAHGHGILHRDLKPDNLLVRKESDGWHVCIIDFGLALRKDATDVATAAAGRSILSGSVTGTMKYAPPEEKGELPGVEPGTWSDVYTFGKTCCFALFGTTEPKRWQWKLVPETLAEVLETCTEESLDRRYADFGPIQGRLKDIGLGASRAPAPLKPPPLKPFVPAVTVPDKPKAVVPPVVEIKVPSRPALPKDATLSPEKTAAIHANTSTLLPASTAIRGDADDKPASGLVVGLWLFFFFPFGLYLLWTHPVWTAQKKMTVTCIWLGMVILAASVSSKM